AEQTTSLWLNGGLHGQPAGASTPSGSMHGGSVSTSLAMLPALMHHGMMIIGLSNTKQTLSNTTTSASSHRVSQSRSLRHDQGLSQDEKILCEVQGKRLGEVVLKLNRV